MRTPKKRHLLHLPEALSKQIDDLARGSGASKSSMLAEALEAWINRRGTSELEDRFGIRLDRISAALGRIERNDKYIVEMLAVYIRFFFVINASVPVNDSVAVALAHDRFKTFTDQVARRVRRDELTFPADPRTTSGDAR